MARHVLDTSGLLCPLPVIRTQAKVAELAPGDELEVLATDPGTRHDIPAWCRVHGHVFLGEDGTTTAADGGELIHLRLRVAG